MTALSNKAGNELMGYVKVAVRIYNPADRSKFVHLDLLADTGAIYTAIPASLLKKINVKPTSTRRFKLANGKVERYPTGEAYVEVAGEGATSIIAFLPEGSVPRLGVTTMELLGLQVDPTTGELKPLELLLLQMIC